MGGRKGGNLDIETRWIVPKWGTFTQVETKRNPYVTQKTGRGVKSKNWEEGRKGIERHGVLKCFLPCGMLAQL